MTTTYDPILEIRDLSRWQVFAPIASPQAGTALVLEAPGHEPLAIYPHERVPSPRLGNYRKAITVDLSQYGLQLNEELPSADRSFIHMCSLTFTCRVEDPVEIVRRGIRDMTDSVRIPLVRIMRAVARSYDISQSNEAEAALNEALEEFTGDTVVVLGSYLVELSVPGAGAAKSSEAFHDISREQRLDKIRRSEMLAIIAGGRDEVIAQWLAKHKGDPSALLEMEAEAKAVESEQVLRAIHMLSVSGKGDEPFDTRDERRRLLGRFLTDAPALPSADRSTATGASRRSRLAGSMGPVEPIEGAVVVPDTEPTRTSRVKGKVPKESEGAPDRPTKDSDKVDERSGVDTTGHPPEPPKKAASRIRGVAAEKTAPRPRPKPQDPDAI